MGSSNSGWSETEISSQDRLVYMITCLIGCLAQVKIKSGFEFSGIIHAIDAERFGVALKFPCLIRDISSGGQKPASHFSKSLIIPADELVQVVAKDVAVTREGLLSELHEEKQQDIMLDSDISNSLRIGVKRKLEQWIPDKDDPQHAELENIFDSPSIRDWDQFKANETLFGIKSTFDLELYTTKLESGRRMRELEEKALKLATEIEAEKTHDLHLAEEKAVLPLCEWNIDEETKYSAAYRGVDHCGCIHDDVTIHACDVKSLEDPGTLAFGRSIADVLSEESYSQDGTQFVEFSAKQELSCSSSLSSDHNTSNGYGFEDDGRVQENRMNEQEVKSSIDKTVSEQPLNDDVQTAEIDDSQFLLVNKQDSSEKAGRPSLLTATYFHVSTMGEHKTNSYGVSKDQPGRVHDAVVEPKSSCLQSSSSAPSTMQNGASTSAASAHESMVNPNAKIFVPSQSSIGPTSPVNDDSLKFSTIMSTVPCMQDMLSGISLFPPLAAAAALQSPGVLFPVYDQQKGQHLIIFQPGQFRPVPCSPAVGPPLAHTWLYPKTAALSSPGPYIPTYGPQYGRPISFVPPEQTMYRPCYSMGMRKR